MSRLNLRSYASSVRVALKIPDSKAQWLGEKVSLVLLGGIILAGTFLGYWSARKLVLSEDGSVNSGIAQFVKWTMRSIGIISILQSTVDVPLGLVALATCSTFSYLVHSKKWHRRSNKNGSLWPRRSKQAAPPDRRAENLSFAPKGTTRSFWGGSSSYSPSPTAGHSFHSIVAGSGYSLSKRVSRRNQDYYSTYHNVPRRKFSEEEWERFTRESTSAALTEWASTPEVTKWIGNNAHRLRLIEEDSNVDDTTSEASSDSSKETVPRNESEPSFFAWL
ncbi:hypothetical protein B296_00056205 [Ensete ventricosum]|uniref:Uncharacterized protein n=1 Tax=Ensete ventricosum TaxID=4639 RepID=A0A426X5G5_ENSVE|nr:hypothetical protein B296_00056205 [Ensete ventricosum]